MPKLPCSTFCFTLWSYKMCHYGQPGFHIVFFEPAALRRKKFLRLSASNLIHSSNSGKPLVFVWGGSVAEENTSPHTPPEILFLRMCLKIELHQLMKGDDHSSLSLNTFFSFAQLGQNDFGTAI